jgi:hypothetical protein
MTYDREIYRMANTLLQKYGAQAPLIAAKGADAEKENGDVVAELVWTAVLHAMLEWVRTERKPGERVN